MNQADNIELTNDLVIRAQNGDPLAFSSLYEQYKNIVYATAYRILTNHHDAEDIVSETFMKVWDKMHTWDGRSFPAWLVTIARNKAIDHKRLHYNSKNVDVMSANENFFEDIQDSSVLPEQSLENLELSNVFMDRLSSVKNPKYKMAYTLRYCDMLSCTEVAQRLGVALSSAKTYIHRCKKDMIKIMKNKYPELYEYYNKESIDE